jgi:class 3 adenylate cyclase
MAQQCASCSSICPDGTRFCLECGSPLMLRCAACEQPTLPGKFCGMCGAPLVAAPTAGPAVPNGAPVSERRTTTVLFADLVSFTALSESRDPEEVRDLLSSYFSVARTVVGRYGGTIEKFIGDAVMAVWGVPSSHEDDAERAVRAGLDLVSSVAALGESVGAPELTMRVGVVTGSVAVTLGATQEGMVAGDAVNTASRVQTAAAPGTVWVDQETHGLTVAAVAFTDMGEHELKGKASPVRLFQAEAVVAAVGGAQRVDGLEAPMVGRDREMRMVRDLLHATEEDGRARLVVVTGQAGMGKSRLGWEFEKYVDGLTYTVRWHRGRCLSYGEGVAFWAFAEMIRSRLGLLESDDQAEVEEKVRTGVEAVAATPAEAAWLTPRVAALLDSGDGEVFDRTDLFASWTTFLERVGGELPVVLLFEDTQYADSGLLDLIDHLLATSRSKLFVLVLTRPELLERRPALVGGRRTTVVELEPLTDAAMTALCDGLVDELPQRARAALVSRAEGVPLYAVETVRSLIDRDAVVASGGRYLFVDHDHSLVDLDQLTAPITLHTLIAARLDTLTLAERRVVQDASVLGLTFPAAALAELSDLAPAELDRSLAALVRKGVLEQQNDPRSPELGQYRFLQAIVREVAYSTLARKDRRARHLAVASQLEREEVADAVAGVIAQHLLDALESSAPDDPDGPAIVARARVLLTSAAERAEALGSPDEALRSALAALDLDPEPLESAQLMRRAGRLALLAGDNRRAEALASAAAARFEELARPVDVAGANWVEARAVMENGRHAEAERVALAGLRLVEERNGEEALAAQIQLLAVLGRVARGAGDATAVRDHTFRQLRLAEELQDPGHLINALNGLAIALIDEGALTAYLAVVDRAVKLSREHHLIAALGRSLTNLSSQTYPDDLTEAATLADEATAVGRKVGNSYMSEVILVNAGYTWLLLGEWERLEAEVRDWLDGGRAMTGNTSALWMLLKLVARARGEVLDVPPLLASEDPYERACSDLVEAFELVDQEPSAAAELAAQTVRSCFGNRSYLEDFEMLCAPAVELQLAVGAHDTAEELLQLAAELVAGRTRAISRGELPRLRGTLAAARGEDPEADLREAEAAHARYGATYLLALTRLELGRWLHGQGRVTEATTVLAQARPTFVDLRAMPAVEAVDRILHAAVSV